MERATRAVEVVVGIATAGALALVAIAIYVASTPSGDPRGWFLAAALTFGGGVVLALFYFGIHPLLVALDGWRVRKLYELRKERAAIPVARQVPPRVASSQASLSIVSAEYGANTTWKDVKSYVNAQVTGGRVVMDVSNDTLGGDPVPNVPKMLKVTYIVGSSEPGSVSVSEGDKLSIP